MGRWTDVAAQGDLVEGAGIALTPGGRRVALFLVGGMPYALENRCSHGMATIEDGYLEGYEVTCTVHLGRFDLRTGAATGAPCTQAIKTWPVRIDNGRVWVALD